MDSLADRQREWRRKDGGGKDEDRALGEGKNERVGNGRVV